MSGLYRSTDYKGIKFKIIYTTVYQYINHLCRQSNKAVKRSKKHEKTDKQKLIGCNIKAVNNLFFYNFTLFQLFVKFKLV